MQDPDLDGENVYGCVLTKLPAWPVVTQVQPQK